MSAQGNEQTGRIHGRAVDATTRRPLSGVAVVVLDSGLETATDAAGGFSIVDVPPGLYRLLVVATGYEAVILHDVVVRADRSTTVTVDLDVASPAVRETVDVTADYFSAAEERKASTVSLGFEEIRRFPGSAGDVSRLLHALPSVGPSTDQRNDLVVRGGSSLENLTIVDNIEVPNINHFPTQGASGGAVGILNVDLISNVSFSAGGFSAEHGDRLSSVMVITQRDGNRTEFDAEANMSMSGGGLVLEGPIGSGRGSWLLSARRSYLELIADAIGTGGVVPKYSNLQAKVTYDLSPTHRLSLLSLGGFDSIEFPADDDVVSVETSAKQLVNGVNWRWLWSDKGYSETSLAHTRVDHSVDVAEESIESTRMLLFGNESTKREVVLRSNWHYRPDTETALVWGVAARRLLGDFAVYNRPARTRVNVVDEGLDLRERLTTGKFAAFVTIDRRLSSRLTATAGARFDSFGLNAQKTWSPRLALAYEVDSRTTATAAAGLYEQTLPLWLLVQHPNNRWLDNQQANHYVVGLRRRLTPSMLFSVEGYRKDYRRLPLDPDDPTVLVVDQFADYRTPVPGRLVGGGEARSTGIEGLVQKKLARDVYGLVSYGYTASRYRDLTGVQRNRTFDSRHVAAIVLGYRPSDRLEYSGRWQYASGRPYTPFDPVLSSEAGVGIIRRDRVNADRFPAYHRLDLRLDHRMQFGTFNVISFVSVLNVYNRDNPFQYYWDADDERARRVNQWGFIPVGGFELEF